VGGVLAGTPPGAGQGPQRWDIQPRAGPAGHRVRHPVQLTAVPENTFREYPAWQAEQAYRNPLRACPAKSRPKHRHAQ
jgi:hypothetical protein